MNQAAQAIANSLQFEAKKNSLGQAQSGDWKLSFTVSAGDVPMPLLQAAMGTRYQVVIVEIDDDETPVKQTNPHRLSQQAAMLCEDTLFQRFLAENIHAPEGIAPLDREWAAYVVRDWCRVKSRSEFDENYSAELRWRDLKAEYEAWKMT